MQFSFKYTSKLLGDSSSGPPTIPIRVCAAQRGRDLGAPDLERSIHFIEMFLRTGYNIRTHESLKLSAAI